MVKNRIPIPSSTAADVMFESDSTCCVCTVRGKAVQIHHIDEDPSNNSPDNLAVLCLQCHDDTQISGGFGRRLNAPLVTKHRDEWTIRVRRRREEADRLAVAKIFEAMPAAPSKSEVPYSEDRADAILQYVNDLPKLREELRRRAQQGWDTGVTATMVTATYDYIDALQGILVHMASFYPGGYFDSNPERFFATLIAASFRWHREHAEPHGPGTGGTIVSVTCGDNVMEDVEKMIKDMAESLVGYDDRFDWRGWPARWGAQSN